MSRASGPSRGRSSTLPSDYKIIYPPSEALQSAGTLPDGYPNKEAWLSAYTRPEDGGTTVVFSRRGMADLISYVPYSPANCQERVIFSARRRGQTATSLHNPLDHLSTVDLSSFAPSQTVTHESNAHQGKQREKGFFPIFNRLRQLSFDDLGACEKTTVIFLGEGQSAASFFQDYQTTGGIPQDYEIITEDHHPDAKLPAALSGKSSTG